VTDIRPHAVADQPDPGRSPAGRPRSDAPVVWAEDVLTPRAWVLRAERDSRERFAVAQESESAAEMLDEAGQRTAADRYWRKALHHYDSLGAPDAAALRALLAQRGMAA